VVLTLFCSPMSTLLVTTLKNLRNRWLKQRRRKTHTHVINIQTVSVSISQWVKSDENTSLWYLLITKPDQWCLLSYDDALLTVPGSQGRHTLDFKNSREFFVFQVLTGQCSGTLCSWVVKFLYPGHC